MMRCSLGVSNRMSTRLRKRVTQGVMVTEHRGSATPFGGGGFSPAACSARAKSGTSSGCAPRATGSDADGEQRPAGSARRHARMRASRLARAVLTRHDGRTEDRGAHESRSLAVAHASGTPSVVPRGRRTYPLAFSAARSRRRSSPSSDGSPQRHRARKATSRSCRRARALPGRGVWECPPHQ
jgi:hypothetical protein